MSQGEMEMLVEDFHIDRIATVLWQHVVYVTIVVNFTLSMMKTIDPPSSHYLCSKHLQCSEFIFFSIARCVTLLVPNNFTLVFYVLLSDLMPPSGNI